MVTPESILATRQKIDREKRLDWNETEMRKGMNSISSSLRDIHDKKLWQDKWASFEDYCKEQWGMSRQRAYQLIGAENTRLLLADAANDDSELAKVAGKLNDRQATELVGVPKEQALAVLRDAIKEPGKLTASSIKQAKARVIGTSTNLPMHVEKPPLPEEPDLGEEPKCCPTCKRPL